MSDIDKVIKPSLRKKLKTKKIPNFLPKLDSNKKYQEEIWAEKTYKVDPDSHVFTTIQEHFGNRLIKNLAIPINGVVVDIGCFIGEKLWQIKEKRCKGIGIDIALPSLIAAKEIDKYGYDYIAADLEDLPLKSNSVDVVMIFDVIEHLSDANKGFSEVARILKPGGQFLLHIPIKNNKWSMFWWKQKLFPKLAQKDYDDVGHAPERMLTTDQIKQKLKANNLSVKKEIYYNSFFVHLFDREIPSLAGSILKKSIWKNKKRQHHPVGTCRQYGKN